jgi:tRNA-splicing endonuclease subunit Sen54
MPFLSSIKNLLIKMWNYTGYLLSFKLRVNWWTRFHPGLVSYFHRTVHYRTHFFYLLPGDVYQCLPASLFKSFRVIPPFTPSRPAPLEQTSSYNIFFHVWKPESPWSRVNPPRPDFEIVVIKYVMVLFAFCSYLTHCSARTTPVPRIDDLAALFDTLPTTPYQSKLQNRVGKQQTTSGGILTRYLAWIRNILNPTPGGKGNPFGHLKAGKRSVIFAVVDVGTTTLYRFNEGCFDEWPMI